MPTIDTSKWGRVLNRLLGWRDEDEAPMVRDDQGRATSYVSNGMLARDPEIADGHT